MRAREEKFTKTVHLSTLGTRSAPGLPMEPVDPHARVMAGLTEGEVAPVWQWALFGRGVSLPAHLRQVASALDALRDRVGRAAVGRKLPKSSR